MSVLTLTVYGRPQPQGSARAFIPKGWKRAVVTSDNASLKPWRQRVSGAAYAVIPSTQAVPVFGAHIPVEITLRFFFTKPKSAKKRPGMTTKPDADKLIRACLDSLTGIMFHDDAQVIEIHTRKMYGGPERCEIEVREAIA